MGGIVEETLSACKLVISFANENIEINKFTKKAAEVKTESQRSEKLTALFYGLFRLMIFGFYVYSFWLGTQMILDKRTNYNGEVFSAGKILTVIIALITGMLMIMQLNPNI